MNRVFQYIKGMIHSDPKTRWFYFNLWIYMILIIITTIYAYARIDFVRSTTSSEEQRSHYNH